MPDSDNSFQLTGPLQQSFGSVTHQPRRTGGTTKPRSALAIHPERLAGVCTRKKPLCSDCTVTVSPPLSLNAGSANAAGEIRAGASSVRTTASWTFGHITTALPTVAATSEMPTQVTRPNARRRRGKQRTSSKLTPVSARPRQPNKESAFGRTDSRLRANPFSETSGSPAFARTKCRLAATSALAEQAAAPAHNSEWPGRPAPGGRRHWPDWRVRPPSSLLTRTRPTLNCRTAGCPRVDAADRRQQSRDQQHSSPWNREMAHESSACLSRPRTISFHCEKSAVVRCCPE